MSATRPYLALVQESEPDLTPLLGDIARRWQRIHPADLNVIEALSLLQALTTITDRLDAEQANR